MKHVNKGVKILKIVSKMDRKGVVKLCKELGCCDACCVRYLGIRNPASYDNPTEFVNKLLESKEDIQTEEATSTDNDEDKKNTETELQDSCIEKEEQSTPAKRCKQDVEVCVSCLGLLQEWTWTEMIDMAVKQVQEKGYSCGRFACALSAPLAAMARERLLALRLKQQLPHYTPWVTPLKEAWKWSFCRALVPRLRLALDSGAVAPLLLTFNIHYPHDKDEIAELRSLSGGSDTRNNKQADSRRVVEEMTSRLQRVPDGTSCLKRAQCAAHCSSVLTEHSPVYLGGRYIKLSRNLPQSPWILNGVRMMPTSVQEIICKPIARLYGIDESDVDRRMKMISAGREDVDVRCLGDGRPFAVEILDPRMVATPLQLQQLCEEISQSDDVKVKLLTHVTKEQLCELKKGEESKFKTYEALCIKLRHTDEDRSGGVAVTAGDVTRVAQLTSHGGAVAQRTPLRVLHRRPLRTRRRRLLHVAAYPVPDEPRLFVVRVQTEAGTYVKEWAHGELGRTAPALLAALPADILALDVTAVHLHWPPDNNTTGVTTTGDATTGDATTGDATTGDATTGDATTGDTITGDTTNAVEL